MVVAARGTLGRSSSLWKLARTSELSGPAASAAPPVAAGERINTARIKTKDRFSVFIRISVLDSLTVKVYTRPFHWGAFPFRKSGRIIRRHGSALCQAVFLPCRSAKEVAYEVEEFGRDGFGVRRCVRHIGSVRRARRGAERRPEIQARPVLAEATAQQLDDGAGFGHLCGFA